ncbi:7-cyano-7-deazaguanine synthase QueC [Desulfobacula sp.]|uniref:7-cyano-7-deazaguanine synthase QueC n=1 Tax=Desulfobacula sp. TaxID=2593537 RepID=UPI0025C447CD|nr:7-cyano-7-deazaguanine synthase QueC [Desulfobacula sp.]MBC2705677.1 7-cyano-7-deazaguanine synthase QueC [Desulfobacula sp.]
MTDKAVVLSSGGIDSTTAMAIAKSRGKEIYALSFRYGQRHFIELEAAKEVARSFEVKTHKIINIDLRQFGGSALTDEINVPKHDSVNEIDEEGIPITYVPARNTIFLSYAMAWAEVLKATSIYIGVTAVDYSGYPDCRPAFIEAFEKMANLATKTGVTKETILKIETPLIHLSKAEIIKTGDTLGVDYALTISCYDPDSNGKSCGRCDSCLHRIKGFKEAGIKDPTIYY